MNQPRPPPPPNPNSNALCDPVHVYLRVRPLDKKHDSSVCVEILDEKNIRLFPSANSLNSQGVNLKEYAFKFVFNDDVSEKALFDRVGLPLVKDLLKGKYGLIFTSGVAGSGKTYTMTRPPQDDGVMPRCLDVIFNSIREQQAQKYTFQPDSINAFYARTSFNAGYNELMFSLINPSKAVTPKTPSRTPDSTKVDDEVVKNQKYAVFVSTFEIYNDHVYDLLDESPIDQIKPPQAKILREDNAHNVYVDSCNQVEVRSTDEALEEFSKGQKRKQETHTTLGTKSSHSHSVFTISLVQASFDPFQGEVIQEKVCISQLCLVDLAADGLGEVGYINSSLVVLGNCIQILRKNQLRGTSQIVPYGNSTLTRLVRNYFACDGEVRMIVCVNPRADDYDETIHVMRFAELITHEVAIENANSMLPSPSDNSVGASISTEEVSAIANWIRDVVNERDALRLQLAAAKESIKMLQAQLDVYKSKEEETDKVLSELFVRLGNDSVPSTTNVKMSRCQLNEIAGTSKLQSSKSDPELDSTKEADCLTHQQQNSTGDVETRLNKENVTPTVGGGAQQVSSPLVRKRNTDGRVPIQIGDNAMEVETGCANALEGHESPGGIKRTRH